MATPAFKLLVGLAAVVVLASTVHSYSLERERMRINSVINSPQFFPRRLRRDSDDLQRLDGRHMFTGTYSGSYVVGAGNFYRPDFTPNIKYTTHGKKFSVFAPPHGDVFPQGGRFFWPVEK